MMHGQRNTKLCALQFCWRIRGFCFV